MRHTLLYLTLVSICVSCFVPPEKRVATPEVVEEVENRKILRLTDAEIVSGAQELGSIIADFLSTQIDSSVCDTRALTLPDSLAEWTSRYVVRCDTLAQDLHAKEKAVLKAYIAGAAAQQVPLEDNIQKIRDRNELLFSRPLYQNDSLAGMLSIVLPRKAVVKELGARKAEAKKRRFGK